MKSMPMPRALVLLFILSAMTMLFVTKCGLNIDSQVDQSNLPHAQSIKSRELFSAVMEESERKHQAVVDELNAKIFDLENRLHELKSHSKNTAEKEKSLLSNTTTSLSDQLKNFTPDYFKTKLQAAEILHGVEMKSEYEIFPFTRFTANRIFLVDPGLGKRVVEKPIGLKKKEINEVIQFAVSILNKGLQYSVQSKQYTPSDFIEGIYRTEPTSGSHYELYFTDIKSNSGNYSKVVVMRPFGPLVEVQSTMKDTSKQWINLILPLSKRLDSFKQFMIRFIKTCILKDKQVYLSVVYFGTEGLTEVKNMMKNTMRKYNFKNLKLITVNEKFSRGRGLQLGALNWKGEDVVMFMCDVDIVFTLEFLERCRVNSEKQKRVYYPIVFSLYNPNVVYSLQDLLLPPEKDQLVISKDTGFWRDFGYGMTCQYRSDFLAVKGFDEHITGWGGEDVFLYQKYVRSSYIVIRATDPGIFHLWHTKHCDPSLTSEQYRSCIRSKALNEASHAQLGLLAFKDEVDIHRSYKSKWSGETTTLIVSHNNKK